MPAALLFDLDGTLLDSDPLHIEVFADLLRPRGIRVDRPYYLKHIHGRLNVDVFAELMPDADPHEMDLTKEAEFRRRLAQRKVPPARGLVALLDRARTEGTPCAVITNAPRINARAMLDAIGLRDRFAPVISSDDIAPGKPDPAPYLAGAAAHGVPARACIAFEDSPSGLQAARTAGCTVVGLSSSLDAAALKAHGAHLAIDDFTDPALADLLDAETGALT